MNIKTVAAALCLLTAAMSAWAEPTPSVRALMGEKLSIFEFGLYKMEKSLDNYSRTLNREFKFDGFNTVLYNWKKNQIEVLWFGFNVRSPNPCDGNTLEDCREITAEIWKKARTAICVSGNCTKSNSMKSWFSHKGFERKIHDGKTDNDLANELVHITHQKVSQAVKDATGKNHYVTCEGSITDNKPACKVD